MPEEKKIEEMTFKEASIELEQILQDHCPYVCHDLHSGVKPLVILIFRFVFIPSFTHFVDNGFDPGQGKFQFFPGSLTFPGNQVPRRFQCLNAVSQQTVLGGAFRELRQEFFFQFDCMVKEIKITDLFH